jgi:hypothetical protein
VVHLPAEARRLPADVPPAWCNLVQPLARRLAQSSETGWLRPVLRDTPEMINDRAKIRKAAHKSAAAAARTQRIAEKQQVLITRRRERRRAHQIESTRKRLARLGASVKGIVRAGSSGSAWRKQLAKIKGRVKTLTGQAS